MTTSRDELIEPSVTETQTQTPTQTETETETQTAGETEDGGEANDQVARLRRQLLAERERSLNATDLVRGAEAEAAQARAEIRELQYRLHVREAELAAATELLAADPTEGRPTVQRRLLSATGRARRLVSGRAPWRRIRNR